MKFKEYLIEAANAYGIVVTRLKENNKFEDMVLVDFNTEDILTHKPGHAQNMFASIVQAVKRHDMWETVEPLLKKAAKTTTKLGADFDDAENFHITKYGPFTSNELGWLTDKIEDAK